MLNQTNYLINEVGKMFHLLYQIDQMLKITSDNYH